MHELLSVKNNILLCLHDEALSAIFSKYNTQYGKSQAHWPWLRFWRRRGLEKKQLSVTLEYR